MAQDNRRQSDMGNDRFRCDKCGQTFDSQSEYRQHQESHQMEKNPR